MVDGKRSLARKLHHRARIIARRLRITRGQWWRPVLREGDVVDGKVTYYKGRGTRPLGLSPAAYESEPGRLSKHNLNCTCRLCKHGHPRYRRSQMRAETRRIFEEELE